MVCITYRQFIAAVATAAVVITGFSSVPARAGQDDLAKALAALAGLAVLGVVIKNVRNDDKKKRPRVTDRRYEYEKRKGHDKGDGFDGRYSQDLRRDVEPRPLPYRVKRKLLPQQCLRSIEVEDGRLRVFGRRCLARHYKYSESLPRKCVRRFPTDQGAREGYGARCLSRKGYALARR